MNQLAAIAAGMSLLAPCAAFAATPSIAARIAAAKPGDTIEVQPGIYREHLRIDKPLRLVGVGRPVIDGGGQGDIVEIVVPDVELRGFVVRDTGVDLDHENCAIRVLAPRATIVENVIEDILFGIDLKAAPDSVIRGNAIGGKELDIARRGDGLRLWRSDRVLIEDNEIHDGRDAILWYSSGVIVRRNSSSRCRYGFHLMYSDHVTLEGNELTENSVGAYFMYSSDLALRRNRIVRNRGPSGYGLGLKETDRYVVEDNVFLGNRAAVYIDGSPFTGSQPGVFRRNTFAFNDVGIAFLPSVRGNVLFENNFVDNLEQVSVQGRGELRGNEFDRDRRGNFWSDYVGYDLDGDGLGEDEHASERLFERLLDREPKLRVFRLSPAEQAIEFVSRVLPAIRPEPKFVDRWPLISPVATEAPSSCGGRGAGGMAIVAVALTGAAACVGLVAGSGAGLARRARRDVLVLDGGPR